jgi:hypothetical protein
MSIQSRKRAAEANAATRHRMQESARPVVLARAAVPMVKTAGMAARDSARGAAAWAAPRVNGARAWTAPRIERTGLAIKDTIAPKICETLTATARRVDVTTPRPDVTAPRRRWPRVVAGTAMLAAVGAAAAIVLRRRNDDGTCGAARAGEASGARSGPQTAQDGQISADGGDGKADVTKLSPAT